MSDITSKADMPQFFGHPRGLVICFFTEMWERFSYYGMRALLILYLTKHFLFSDQSSAAIYASYISLVYIAPVIGGILADRYLGQAKAVTLGAILLVCGHFGMAFEGAQATEAMVDGVLTVTRDSFYLQVFYLSLALIITGVGFLKPNISTIVGALYEENDPRRDGGFSIFYMGINLGAFTSALACGYLGETYGWAYGFGLAGFGMLLGLFVFTKYQHWLEGHAAPKNPAVLKEKSPIGISKEWTIYLSSIIGVLAFWWLVQNNQVVGSLLGVTGVVMVSGIMYFSFTKCTPHERDRMIIAMLLISYQVLFWGLFEQTGSSLNLLADRNVDRFIFGWEVPASMFQSVNAFFIVTLAPLFAWGWVWLSKRGWEPSTPMKFAIALIQLGMGFLLMVFGAGFATDAGTMALIWLVLLYLLHTTGELCLSPVGLSMVTKLSVPRVVGMMMGVWFLASAAGNFVSGVIAGMTGSHTVGGEVVDKAASLARYMDVYQSAGLICIAIGVVAILVVPLLKRGMHGIH